MSQILGRVSNLPLVRTITFGTGGSGCATALSVQVKRLHKIISLCSVTSAERDTLWQWLIKFFPCILSDSDQMDGEVFAPQFAGDEPERIVPPDSYIPLASPSGKTIINNLDTLPYKHLKDYQPLPFAAGKSSDSEAEGNRLYGALNGLVNVRRINKQIKAALEQLDAAQNSETSLHLEGKGIQPRARIHIEFFSSLAGGQGSGLVVLLLGLLSKQIEARREQYRINLHLLLPGFFVAQNDFERLDQMFKAMSVLNDLVRLKLEGRSLTIPYPDGTIELESHHTTELYNFLFLHQPAATDTARYESFIHRISEAVVDAEFSSLATDLRRARSNANELARRSLIKNNLALVGSK